MTPTISRIFFTANDLDYEAVTIIRREILPSGKSRAFINDSPVNLNELVELGDFLIDIHSQHQTRELTNEDYQTEILDAFASNQTLLTDYKQHLSKYKTLKSDLKKLIADKESLTKEYDYNSFLLNELLVATLKSGEQEELEAIQERLSNVEFIGESLDKSLAILNEEQIGVIQNLKEVKMALQKISGLSENYNTLYERVSSILIEADDIASELVSESEKLVNNRKSWSWSIKSCKLFTLC